MTSLLRNLRARFDGEYARRQFLDRCETFDDPALRQRLVDAINNAIAAAEPDQLDTDTDGGVDHTCVWWTWRRRDVSAQRTVHPHRTDHALYVDGRDPDAGPCLITLDAGVRFMPGCGFGTPQALLDWFEEQA